MKRKKFIILIGIVSLTLAIFVANVQANHSFQVFEVRTCLDGAIFDGFVKQMTAVYLPMTSKVFKSESTLIASGTSHEFTFVRERYQFIVTYPVGTFAVSETIQISVSEGIDIDGAEGAFENVTVADCYLMNAVPDCESAAPSIAALWPSNHQFVPVNIFVTDADGDVVTTTIDSIFQDEAVNASGSGNTSPDGQGIGTSTAQVRAERAEPGNGRFYHIGFTANDGHGGICSGVVKVSVPRNQGQNGAAVDDGASYNSTQP